MNPSLLIIDDDRAITEALHEYFSVDYDVQVAGGGRRGLEMFEESVPVAVILDLRMPDLNGMEVLAQIRKRDQHTPVIMLTAYGDIEVAVQAIKLGADQFLTKPVDLTALDALLLKASRSAHAQRGLELIKERFDSFKQKLVLDKETQRAVEVMAANPDTTVLIAGPTGAGKGVVAELIHRQSARGSGLFVDVNCAGLSEGLLESELFGHEKGAFTDAKNSKKGLMEVADGGTLFLDEVGEMPLAIQAKLLKAIETKTFRRVGGSANIHVNVRIMAATNADLAGKVEKGQFRDDLFFRLNVVPIKLKTLSERKDDIPKLAMMFLKEFSTNMNKSISAVNEEAMQMLIRHDWPGNIRELRNVIERAAILSEGNVIGPESLPEQIGRKRRQASPSPSQLELISLSEMEKRQILFTLEQVRNNKTAAAKILQIDVTTLSRKIKRYKLKID